MKTRKIWNIGWISLIMALPCFAADANDTVSPPYLGEEPPGLVPKVFAPDFISLSNRYENNICFTKDGSECYFVTRTSNWSSYQILETHYENGQWTTPRRTSFTNNLSLCPSLANDDQYLYYSMSSPNIYRVTRTATGWSNRTVVPSPVSSSQAEWSCHVSDLGNMWVCSWRSGGVGGCDQWRILNENGQFTQAENLRSLNTTGNDCGPVPGPNESYIVWMSNRPGGFGGSDLYVSFADGEGGWTTPQNLGPTINTSGTESSAYLSPDYKYLFYSGTAAGTADVYWVSVEAFLPDPNGPVLNLTTSQRFSSIQAAVNFADSGQTILLSPGHYKENIIVSSKELTICSDNSQDSADVSLVTVSGDNESPVFTISRGSIVELQGLTIRDGGLGVRCSGAQLQMDDCIVTSNADSGIELSEESGLVMTNCIVAGNSGEGLLSIAANRARQGLVYNDVDITNCTIVQNQRYAVNGNQIAIKNSILYFNGQLVDDAQISGDDISVTFSNVQGRFDGEGNIDADPEFVVTGAWADPNNYTPGDYHLKSTAGHWDALDSVWVLDEISSPCIDAGDPNDPVGDEPDPNGGRINMGAYGGTAEASKS